MYQLWWWIQSSLPVAHPASKQSDWKVKLQTSQERDGAPETVAVGEFGVTYRSGCVSLLGLGCASLCVRADITNDLTGIEEQEGQQII